MNANELILLERLIEKIVTKVIGDVLGDSFKKDIKEVKLLTAKLIKENRELKKSSINEVISRHGDTMSVSFDSSNAEIFSSKMEKNKGFSKSVGKNDYSKPLPKLPETYAKRFADSNEIPDIDAPIYFDPNSDIMRAVKEKYSSK